MATHSETNRPRGTARVIRASEPPDQLASCTQLGREVSALEALLRYAQLISVL